jgi:predicted TIM-barrel fold metal-dependent hydrolase
MMIVSDVQVHLWEAERPDKPWPPFSRKPHKPNGFSVDEMLADGAAGVDRAVIVPPTWAATATTTR